MDNSRAGGGPGARQRGREGVGAHPLLRGVCRRAPARGRVAHSPLSNIENFMGSGKRCSKCSFRTEPDGVCWDLAKVPDTPLLSTVPSGGFVFRSGAPASSCEAERQLAMPNSWEPRAAKELRGQGEPRQGSKAEEKGSGGWRSGPGWAAPLCWQEADAHDQ